MDIQEIMQYSKNKIEADDLAKQVRRRIKETAWEKQNQREGFSETFKPLISQFEKPEDSKKENIFTQNQKMRQNQLALTKNQLALTEGLKENQKAITDGLAVIQQSQKIKPDDDDDDDDIFTGTYEEYQDKYKDEPKPSSSNDSEQNITLDVSKGFSQEQKNFIFKKDLLDLND